MASKALNLTTPVGRLVGGSLYEPKTTDFDGKPLTVKTGPNAGQPRQEYSFAVAIRKNPGETHWSQHPFFAPIWAYGYAAFTAGEAQHPTFAWKIQDGDSTIPNKKGKKNCEREGFPGHWIIWFSGGQAPRVYNANGTAQILEKDAVKPGYFVQVFGNVTDNKPSQSPGLYINHSMVALAAYGEEIVFGPDVSAAGFGQGTALPPGAMTAPPAGAIPATGAPTPPAPPVAAAPVPPAAPARVMLPAAGGQSYEALIAAGWNDALLVQHGMMAAPTPRAIVQPVPRRSPAPLAPVGSVPTPAAPAPTVVAPPPSPVTPNPAILAVPGTPPAPPAAVSARVMLPAANGASYESLIAAGWTDALLVQHGMMAA